MKIVSIIIPTFNRSHQLNRTLFSLMELKTSRDLFEIIVVDNGSTDNTKDVVIKYQIENSLTKIKYFYDPIPGLLTGRHRGANEAEADVLTFIDDDVHVSSTWLDTIIDVMENKPEISFLTGPNLPLYESYPPEWIEEFWNSTPYGGRMCDSLSLLDIGKNEIEIDPNYVWGLNFTVRKETFIELKGFQPDNMPPHLQMFQGGGETGLTQKGKKENKKALYNSGVLVYHEVPSSRLTPEYFDKRAYYLGLFLSYTELRNKHFYGNTHNINKEERFSFYKTYRLFFRFLKKGRTTPHVKSKVKLKYELKVKEGYDYHQKIFHENDVVKDWVFREDYMNYELPNLKDLQNEQYS